MPLSIIWRNKLPCEGNSLSYFKFVSETLTHSGLRKFLSPTPSSRVTSSISSPTSSSILVISRGIRSKHISNFVNFQPEENHERRRSTGKNTRGFWGHSGGEWGSHFHHRQQRNKNRRKKNCRICEKTFFGGKQPLKRRNLLTEKFETRPRSRKGLWSLRKVIWGTGCT